jgi:hypothetical protein
MESFEGTIIVVSIAALCGKLDFMGLWLPGIWTKPFESFFPLRTTREARTKYLF